MTYIVCFGIKGKDISIVGFVMYFSVFSVVIPMCNNLCFTMCLHANDFLLNF